MPGGLAMVRTDRAGALWESFAIALGAKEMVACYGWDETPRNARWGEAVYKFHSEDERGAVVGWSSLSKYPKEPDVFELAIGVWPSHQGNGYRRDILDQTVNVAFVDHRVEQVVMLVLDSCKKHAVQCLRDAERGSPWVYSGRVWYPDPLRTFTLTLEAWESSDAGYSQVGGSTHGTWGAGRNGRDLAGRAGRQSVRGVAGAHVPAPERRRAAALALREAAPGDVPVDRRQLGEAAVRSVCA